MSTFISLASLADLLSTSVSVVRRWAESGVYPLRYSETGRQGFYMEDLQGLPAIDQMLSGYWQQEMSTRPLREYSTVELFAGAGGLALGMHMAGFRHVLLNEYNPHACQTLRTNMPHWQVLEQDIEQVDFSAWRGSVDLLTGGFPCQAFSYAGKKEGLNDARGTLFFSLARAVDEIRPRVLLAENVKGLLSHDGGRTLEVIRQVIASLGYTLIEPKLLKAIMYQVPQKRERLMLVAVRNDLQKYVSSFEWPSAYRRVLTIADAFSAGLLYPCDVPKSVGAVYPEKKAKVLSLVPEGGDWRDLPEQVQRSYLGASFHLGGGKTGIARRLSMSEPALTLTCAPAQKQTERCHPIETRPLTVREYARLQTFPDSWSFSGPLSEQYKQIGNAVPVNLAYAVGRALVRFFNHIEQGEP